jgi:hypothetical protein
MSQEVKIKFFELHDKWRWHISCGNWQQAGYGLSLEDAKKHAFDYVRGIPNHGTINIFYDNGMPVEVMQGKASDHWLSNQ